MSLHNFCAVCRIPYEGELEEPHRKDVDGFVNRRRGAKEGFRGESL